jgi:hypothetical protein
VRVPTVVLSSFEDFILLTSVFSPISCS